MAIPLRCPCGHSVEAHELFRFRRGCAACVSGGCRKFGRRRDDREAPGVVVPGVAWTRFRSRDR